VSQFVQEKKLPPIELTLELAERLEALLTTEVRERRVISEKASDEFSMRIADAFGTETLGSRREYRPALLSDSTSEVRIRYRSGHKSESEIDVDIVFSPQREWSRYRVEVQGDSAREIALATSDAIDRLVEPHRRTHGYLHLGLVGFIARSLGSWVGATMLVAGVVRPSLAWVGYAGAVLVVLSVAHWMGGRYMLPYTIFDSAQARRRSQTWKWFVTGIATFLLFGTILTAMRRRIFGF